MLVPRKESCDKPKHHIKKKKHHFTDKSPYSQSYGFSSSNAWMWKLDHKEDWAPKNWCFWTVVLWKALQSPLDCKEIKSVNPKGNQPWIFTGRTDNEAEAPILWLPGGKSRLTEKYPDAGKDWRQKEKRVTENRCIDSITYSMDMNLSKLWEIMKYRGAWRAAVFEVEKSQIQPSDWTTIPSATLIPLFHVN